LRVASSEAESKSVYRIVVEPQAGFCGVSIKIIGGSLFWSSKFSLVAGSPSSRSDGMMRMRTDPKVARPASVTESQTKVCGMPPGLAERPRVPSPPAAVAE
jgi:hypothetical protein